MKKILLLLLLLFGTAKLAFAQSTLVSATITDAGAQSWNNGTYKFTFVPVFGNAGPYIWTGGAFSLGTTVSGSLDGTGTFTSVSVPSNTAITSSGTQWKVQVCPMGTGACFATNLTITGASQSLTSSVIPPAISVPPTGATQTVAYADSEITGAVEGSSYFNFVNGATRQFHNGAWQAGGGGGVSSPITVPVTVATGGSITPTGTGSINLPGWHRLGTVIASSLAADQFSFAESRTIIDTTCPLLPNLLPGETCFRTWGAAGYSAGCIAYFEAPTADPFAQIRSATCAPSGHAHITVRKLDSTHYYLIGTNSFGGSTGIDIYSSATGNQDWALLQANIVVLGAGGTWESNNLGNTDIHFAGDLDGTANVYLYYEAQNATPKWAMGLATCSSNCFGGAATWTKSGSNPLMATPASNGGCEVRLFGSTYAARCHGELSIPSGGTAILPSDLTGIWTASAPAGPWTAPTNLDLQRATFDEGPTGFVGQLNKPTTLDLNGICYLFYSATTDGGQQGGGFHTKLAVANATCAAMATTKGGSVEPDRLSGQQWATVNTAFPPPAPGILVGSGPSTTATPAPDLFIQKFTSGATHVATISANCWAQPGLTNALINVSFPYCGGWQYNANATPANNQVSIFMSNGILKQNALLGQVDTNGLIFDTLPAIIATGTSPVITGTGACATHGAVTGGAWVGSSSCTAATAASTLTLTFSPTAPAGWTCTVQDETTRANLFQQTSHTTTTAVFTATSVTQNDVFVFDACHAF
jgi:hypothetical protein